MKKSFIVIFLAISLSGCPSSRKPDLSVDPATAIWIELLIPYKEGAKISSEIKLNCDLQNKLSHFIKIYSDRMGVGVLQVVNNRKKKNRLEITIDDAFSGRTGTLAHEKFTRISGVLYKSNKKVASFAATRMSGGGFFAGFKGSCSVLGRTLDALGEDVARWLRIPIDGIHMGDDVR